MSYVSLGSMLKKARSEGYGVGAFNTVNYLTTKAIIDGAVSLNAPVIIQSSVKTVKEFGVKSFIDMVIPLISKASVDVCLHLDHCTDISFAKECIDAGWSSIMYDGSKLSIEENIKNTNELISYIDGRDISLEGEIGSILGVEDDIVVSLEESAYGKIEDCKRYLEETASISCLAPAIGTAHGVYKGDIVLNYDLFKDINKISYAPLVLHGGSGLSEEMFNRLIDLGASKVNISTDIKISYCQGMREYMTKYPEENDPLKLDNYVYEKVRKLAYDYINFFTLRKGGINNG